MPYKTHSAQQVNHKIWRNQNRERWGEIDPRSITPLKICTKCGESKPSTEFNIDHGLKSGLHSWCKKCVTTSQRLGKYGVDLPEGAQCKICGMAATDVDHDRETGDPRGFLCSPCNLGLGKFRHNIDLLIAAAYYLYTSGNPKKRSKNNPENRKENSE